MDEPRWISAETAKAIHTLQLAEHGGQDGVRDEGLLESALQRPLNQWRFAKADWPTLAAAYAFGLAKNHALLDGNKRTAAVVCETFLNLNGLEIAANNDEWYEAVLGLASGEIDEASFAQWLRERLRPAN